MGRAGCGTVIVEDSTKQADFAGSLLLQPPRPAAAPKIAVVDKQATRPARGDEGLER
jgi:hypothetical protein